MAANLDASELEALAGSAPTGPTPGVAERDFGQPRRLTQSALLEAGRRVEASLATAEQDLVRWLRAPVRLELSSVGEVDAREVFAQSQDPLAAIRFRTAGQLGWMVWENPPGVAAVERVLGSLETDDGDGQGLPSRTLSRLECSVLLLLWKSALESIGTALGLQLEDLAAVSERRQAGSALDVDSTPDLHRLAVELEFTGGPLDSRVQIYLPLAPGSLLAPKSAPASAKQLPAHLDAVPLEVSVELGRAELQLSDLMALEPGDVIPLDSLVQKPLTLEVDGRPVADVRLGRAHGRLAARLIDAPRLDIGRSAQTAPQPPESKGDPKAA